MIFSLFLLLAVLVDIDKALPCCASCALRYHYFHCRRCYYFHHAIRCHIDALPLLFFAFQDDIISILL